MSTATLQAPITVEQFAALQCGDTEDYELVEGELIPLSSGTPLHAAVRDSAGDLLRAYLRTNQIGKALAEIDCRLTPKTVRRPDVSVFLGRAATDFDPNRVPVPYAPTIAIEVLSPSEGIIDVNRKSLEYIAAGCQEVWLLDSANDMILIQTNQGIRLLRGTDTLESPLLPGFAHPVSAFLRGL